MVFTKQNNIFRTSVFGRFSFAKTPHEERHMRPVDMRPLKSSCRTALYDSGRHGMRVYVQPTIDTNTQSRSSYAVITDTKARVMLLDVSEQWIGNIEHWI